MDIGYVGLGKMGLAQVMRLLEKRWRVVAWNRSEWPRAEAKRAGAEVVQTMQELCKKLSRPVRIRQRRIRTGKLIWLMVPHAVVDEMLAELVPLLSKGDTIIDGGNSFYKDSMRRAVLLKKKGINFLDCGTSGGPFGARHGACLMIGGDKKVFAKYERLFCDLSAGHACSDVLENNRIDRAGAKRSGLNNSYAHVGKSGAGHFVKMVHNGIEYGMMQAIGEGFEVLKRSRFKLPLRAVAELYNHGSVIESRLIGWLAKAFKEHGENLKDISGEVGHLGEGKWTIETAKKLGVPVKVIKDSLNFRLKSKGNPSFTGQVVSALRNQFGGHGVSKK